MNKKINALMFALAVSVSSVFASDAKINGIWYNFDDSTLTATVTYGSSGYEYSGDVSIPDTVIYNDLTYNVTSIGDEAFFRCDCLNSVTIGNNVTAIGTDAFRDCIRLTTIIMPNNVRTIGERAFSGCWNLNSIEIPSSVVFIGSKSFLGCKNLTSINVDIDNSAYCSIDGVLLNKGYDTLIVYPCGKQGAYTIPEGIHTIEEWAFFACNGLINVTIANSVTSIRRQAFAECKYLTSVSIGNNVDTIGKSAFSNCTSLSNVSMGNKVTCIEKGAFQNCDSLVSVEIPNTVTTIESYAFSHCHNLSNIEIPNSVTSIGDYAFNSCTSLTSITCHAITPINIAEHTFYSVDDSIPLYVPRKSIPRYQVATGWKEFLNILPIQCFIASGTCGDNLTWELSCDSLLTIRGTGEMANYDFVKSPAPWSSYNSAIQLITVNEGITNIGDFAFYTSSAETIALPNTLMSIGYQAFGRSQYLKEIEIPNSVTTIGGCAFASCSSLINILIPQNVTNIGSSAFDACSNMISIDVAEDNADYCSIDGVLFDSDTTTLIKYPQSKQGECVIPGSVTQISARAINNSNIYTITCEAVNPPALGKVVFEKVDKTIPLYVPAESIELYRAANQWRDFYNILPIPVPCQHDLFYEDTTLCEGSILHEDVSFTWHRYAISHPILVDTIYNLNEWPSLYRPAETFTYFDSLKTIDGCDSVFQLNVTWIPSYSVIIYDTIYEGDNHYALENNWAVVRSVSLQNTEIRYLNYATMLGCDSVEEWIITILPLPEFTISTAVNSSKYGFVEGAGTYKRDTTITITAIPNKGYQFNQWSDGNTDNPRQVTVTQDSTFTAIFGVKMCSWLVESNDLEMGAVITNFNDAYYQYGTQITVEASPNSGYKFVKWNDGKKFNPYKFSILDDKYLLAIFMEETEEQDTTTVTPTSTTATFTWPFIIGGFSYSLTIYLDAACTIPFCTITFNQYGQFIGISFGNRAPRRYAEQEDGFTYTVSGLDANTEYYFKMETMDEDKKLINTDEGAFRTTDEATGIENQYNTVIEHRKVMINGQIYIIRGDKTYTTDGRLVR